MVAAEAMASGKPVVALGRGGVLESLPPNWERAGVLYSEPSQESLAEALKRFERIESTFIPGELQSWATRFSESRFREEMREVIGLDEKVEGVPDLVAQRTNGRLAK